jgi:uncharacterized protein YndB with AHSA1/START domain
MKIEGAGEMTYTGAFEEIREPERIAYHANFGPMVVRVTVEFVAMGERTRVILTQDGLPSKESCGYVSQGTDEAFDRLEQLLAGQAPVRVAVGA